MKSNGIESRNGEHELAVQRERFQLLVEGVKEYAIIMLDPDGIIVSWNGGAERIKGYSAEEALGRHFSLFYTPEAIAAGYPQMELRTARAEGSFEEEGWRVRKDGTRFWASVLITALVGDEGELRGFAKVTRDLTDRRAQSQERERLQLAAEAASRAKTEFLSRMSHELRTPLNAVLGFAQLLGLDALRPEQREAVDQIQRSGELLLALIEEILDISMIEGDRLTLSLEPIQVDELVRQCLQIIAPMAAEHGIRIVAPPHQDTGIFAVADQQRLKQALLNLLSNAVKYNSPHGSIWLTLTVDEGRTRISVGDSGRGIEPESIERLFTPFERLGAESGDVAGTGLGLSLSKRLVELMGGTLTVESELGKGSVFHIGLERTDEPIYDGEPMPAGAPSTAVKATVPAGAPSTAVKATVLYIEDNLANLRLVERILAHAGNVEVISAMQGKLGLEFARAHRPDMILLDLHLPDMTGEDVAAALKQDDETRDIPIVILTAAAHASQRRRLLELGVHAYLTKPFNVAEMLNLVDQVIGGDTPPPPPRAAADR
jgi:PAS domain S-box-containing protein